MRLLIIGCATYLGLCVVGDAWGLLFGFVVWAAYDITFALTRRKSKGE